MAHPAIGYTLSTILLTIAVVVPRVPGSSITCDSSATVIQSASYIQPANLPAGYVAHYDTGVAYKINLETVIWKVAKERCISEGAQLAVIDTWIKFEFLMNQTDTNNMIWVGILGMYDDTEWVNANTGSKLTNLPWASGEPNERFDCVATRVWQSGNKRGLTNQPCYVKFYYVCEVQIRGN